MCTWEEIGEKWSRAQQMGWQAIQARLDVGDELRQKKIETPHGEWEANLARVLSLSKASADTQASRLMRLALHRDLIEEHKPKSLNGALKLLPKVPRKVGEKKIQAQQEKVDHLRVFAKETAKKQAAILAKEMVKMELGELQNQAHDAVMAELKAVRKKLDEEQKRNFELMTEADEKRQFYQDLINNRMNGYDWKMGMKVLRQAVHPDRGEATLQIRTKAMETIKHLSAFFQI